MPKFERHIFVCINQREAGHHRGCCADKDAKLITETFKAALKARGLNGRVRANKSQCLDQCEHGPMVVVYPEQVWYGFVGPGDVEEIVERHIVGGEPVERLVLPDGCVNATSCPHKPGGTVQLGL